MPFRQNQYGFSLGGPVVLPKLYNGRDKTFWFFEWEAFRERQGRTQISTTPIQPPARWRFFAAAPAIYDPFTSVVGAGGVLIRQPFAGNMIPKSRINPAISHYVDTVMPLPNRSGVSNNLINTQGLANDRDIWNVRLDHTFVSKDNVFFRYSSQDVGQISPNANLNFYNTSRFDERNMAAAWNHIFSATTVLETKFGSNNPSIPSHDVDTKITRSEFLQKSGITMFQPDVLFDPIPNLNAVGEFSVPNNGSNSEDHVYQGIANFSTTLGRHTFQGWHIV